jgi:hypothetical protein
LFRGYSPTHNVSVHDSRGVLTCGFLGKAWWNNPAVRWVRLFWYGKMLGFLGQKDRKGVQQGSYAGVCIVPTVQNVDVFRSPAELTRHDILGYPSVQAL